MMTADLTLTRDAIPMIAKKLKEVIKMTINITPMQNYFNSLSSTPIINRLNKLYDAKTPEEKQAIYDGAMQFLDACGQREKWQKTFDKRLTD